MIKEKVLTTKESLIIPKGQSRVNNLVKALKENYQLYLLLLPTVLYFIIFKYVPMYGVQIAFKNYSPVKGFLGSPLVGFSHFTRFFNSADFWTVLVNTLGISLYNLILGFPIPIILALMMNQINSKWYKRIIQTVIYAPHFISIVVIVGMITIFLSPRTGVINIMLQGFGFEPVFFMGKPEYFKTIYVISEIWQNAGWGTVIYLASLAGINPEQYESAEVDGASKLHKIIFIDLPGIIPTAIVLLILNSGRILSVGFEKIFLMQNSLNRLSSEVIQTYVYKQGILQGSFSYSTAIGLFDSIVNLIILLLVNWLAKRYSENSLL